MILGQLIQTGRRFCECRPADFIPETDERLVVMAYTVNDRLIARSIDASAASDIRSLRQWLQACGAIGYIVIARHPQNDQPELPSPIGRPLMNALTIAAVATRGCAATTFLLDRREAGQRIRLVLGAAGTALRHPLPLDLLDIPDESRLQQKGAESQEEALLSF